MMARQRRVLGDPVRGVLVRMRATAGQLALLALLTMVAGTLTVGAPRVANQLTDDSLRHWVASRSYELRDLSYLDTSVRGSGVSPSDVGRQLDHQRSALQPWLAERIDESWWSVTTAEDASFAGDTGLLAPAQLRLRAGNGWQEAVRLVDGRWPNTDPEPDADPLIVEAVLSQYSADKMDMGPGTQFTMGQDRPVTVEIVGVFAPLDETADVWDPVPTATRVIIPTDDGEPYKAILLADMHALQHLHEQGLPTENEWRYQIAGSALNMATLPTFISAVVDARQRALSGTVLTSLDVILNRFAETARAGQALVAVVQAGVLATLLGLVLLSSRLAVERRRAEFALLRARGGALSGLGWRILWETLPIVPASAVVGAVIGLSMPGRSDATSLVLVVFALVALLAIPVLTMLNLRRLSFSDSRQELGGRRIGLKRLTAELSLLLLAGLGVLLLRRRGLNPDNDVDVYLISVPVLLAAGAAVLTLRAIPAPLGWASRLAGRAIGTVNFLGLARAGRTALTSVGPVAVLVIAVCTAVFSIGVAGTVDEGRDRAAAHDIAGSAVIEGYFFEPDTTEALAALPGVTAVAPYLGQPATDILSSRDVGAERLGQAYVVLVDASALADVLAAADTGLSIDPDFATAGPGEPAPVLLSPAVAQRFGAHSTAAVPLQDRLYDVRVAGVVEHFPSIPRTARNFIVIAWQALPAAPDRPLIPNGFVLAGDVDSEAIVAIGNEGQLRWISRIGTPRNGFEPTTKVTTWADRRAALEQTGVNAVLAFAYQVGTVGGVLLALLAVGFAVIGGARTRGKVLSRLRTMGMTRRQGRGLLLVELAPLIILAVLTGGTVGVILPELIAPALGLTTFTDGFDVGIRLDPLVLAGAIGLVLVGLLTAVAVEALFNRRQRLGEVLRLGEEN